MRPPAGAASLPEKTLVRFVLWNLFGIGVYLAYGRWRSLQRRTGQ
jgi:APA family basic amino acid/polyamine antiporter